MQRVNYYLKSLVASLGYWSGLYPLVLLYFRRGRIATLHYHDPAPDVLARHLEYLATRFKFGTMDRLMAGAWPRRWEPSWIVITLDDGHGGNYRLRSLFREYGVRPTVYLCSGIVGTRRRFWFKEVPSALVRGQLKRIPDSDRRSRLRAEYGFTDKREWELEPAALRVKEIEEMVRDMDFGAHTRFHPILTRCDDSTCSSEISDSRLEVEAVSGSPCKHFAFPNGDYADREIEMVRRAGYGTARTVEWGWMKAGDDRFLLKSIYVPDDASIPVLAGQLCGTGEVFKILGHAQRGLALAVHSATRKLQLGWLDS